MSEKGKTVSLEGYEAYIVARRGEETTSVEIKGNGLATVDALCAIITSLTQDLLRQRVGLTATCRIMARCAIAGIRQGVRRSREARRHGAD